MRHAKVLIVGVSGLTNEISKNIVLAGVGSVTISDHRKVDVTDLGAQFFLPHESVGRNVGDIVALTISEMYMMTILFADRGIYHTATIYFEPQSQTYRSYQGCAGRR
jgi:ubiquitin-like 1-activating enzyme E1 A